jgi:hypothetical protein
MVAMALSSTPPRGGDGADAAGGRHGRGRRAAECCAGTGIVGGWGKTTFGAAGDGAPTAGAPREALGGHEATAARGTLAQELQR